MKTIELRHVILTVLLMSLFGLWCFGRTRRIEVVSIQQPTKCSYCHGTGKTKCRDCAGFGSNGSAKSITCQHCGGTGKYRPYFRDWEPSNPICPWCRGTGFIDSEARKGCLMCRGEGIVKCEHCNGAGTGKHARTIQQVRCGYSAWERFLSAFHVSPEQNPKPQRLRNGEFPIVQKYAEIMSRGITVKVIEWNDFYLTNSVWHMEALVAITDRNNKSTTRLFDVSCRDRCVIGAKPLGRPTSELAK